MRFYKVFQNVHCVGFIEFVYRPHYITVTKCMRTGVYLLARKAGGSASEILIRESVGDDIDNFTAKLSVKMLNKRKL